MISTRGQRRGDRAFAERDTERLALRHRRPTLRQLRQHHFHQDHRQQSLRQLPVIALRTRINHNYSCSFSTHAWSMWQRQPSPQHQIIRRHCRGSKCRRKAHKRPSNSSRHQPPIDPNPHTCRPLITSHCNRRTR
jgi:hypothetical protein